MVIQIACAAFVAVVVLGPTFAWAEAGTNDSDRGYTNTTSLTTSPNGQSASGPMPQGSVNTTPWAGRTGDCHSCNSFGVSGPGGNPGSSGVNGGWSNNGGYGGTGY